MTQTQWVRAQLVSGRKLTPIDALRGFGIFRLAARVQELRYAGVKIKSRVVQRNSKRFSEYWV